MAKQITEEQAKRYYSDAVWLFMSEDLTHSERAVKISEYLFETHGIINTKRIIKLALPEYASK